VRRNGSSAVNHQLKYRNINGNLCGVAVAKKEMAAKQWLKLNSEAGEAGRRSGGEMAK
jgi:hypothetical protein